MAYLKPSMFRRTGKFLADTVKWANLNTMKGARSIPGGMSSFAGGVKSASSKIGMGAVDTVKYIRQNPKNSFKYGMKYGVGYGIGGGVALSALQLAKLSDAEVIVTSSSDAKLKHAAQIGADHLINYKTVNDVAQKVKDITSGRGVDIIVDTVGAATWPIDFSTARRGGKIVLCGVTSDAQAVTDLRTLYWNQLTILGSTMGSDEDLYQMLKAVTQAKLKLVIDSVVKLENIKEATGRMEKAEQFGKIVLEICK